MSRLAAGAEGHPPTLSEPSTAIVHKCPPISVLLVSSFDSSDWQQVFLCQTWSLPLLSSHCIIWPSCLHLGVPLFCAIVNFEEMSYSTSSLFLPLVISVPAMGQVSKNNIHLMVNRYMTNVLTHWTFFGRPKKCKLTVNIKGRSVGFGKSNIVGKRVRGAIMLCIWRGAGYKLV